MAATPAPTPKSTPFTEPTRRSHEDVKQEFRLSLELNPGVVRHVPEYDFKKVLCVPCNRVCALNGEHNLANFFIHCDTGAHKRRLLEEGLVWNAPPTLKPIRRKPKTRKRRRRQVEVTPLYKMTVNLAETYRQTQECLIVAKRLICPLSSLTPSSNTKNSNNNNDSKNENKNNDKNNDTNSNSNTPLPRAPTPSTDNNNSNNNNTAVTNNNNNDNNSNATTPDIKRSLWPSKDKL